jgi:outer membrane lipoprotein
MLATKSSWLLLAISVVLAGCASTIPPEISSPPANSPTVSIARGGIEPFLGSEVRWGGLIVSVQNRENDTRIEIVARELNSSGRPLDSDFSPGRFIAVLEGFIDPAVYAEKRQITVYGMLLESVDQLIDQHVYAYPVVAARSYMLWQPLPERDPYMYSPYWYDPWYGPWHGPYRWHGYRHHGYHY